MKHYAIRSSFQKTLRKDPEFWRIAFIQDFLEIKLKNLSPSTDKLQNQVSQERAQKEVEIIFSFFEKYPNFAPYKFDLRDIFTYYLLMVSHKSESSKLLIRRISVKTIDLCADNYQYYLSCLKIIFSTLKFTYKIEDKFQCPYSAYEFFQQLNEETLKSLMNPSLVGELTWNSSEWLTVFKNFVKVGLNKAIGIIFLQLLRGFENMKFFDVLIRVQEEVTLSVLIALKITEWRLSAFEILKFLILEGPINSNIIEKVIEKLHKIMKEANIQNEREHFNQLLIFLGHISIKYKVSSVIENISYAIQSLYEDLNIPNTIIESAQQRYTIRSWLDDKDVVQNKLLNPTCRGLINLGNTCYMNSFIQSLYMTKPFRFNILSFSLPNLKTRMEEHQKCTDNKILLERKQLLVMFQLQKLFALLLQSKREAINPSFFKAILPDYFRESFAQQDAAEFGRIFLDQYDDALKLVNKSVIKELFSGDMISRVICQDCNKKFERKENFMEIGLHFESNDSKQSYELTDMIQKNFETMEFKNENAYFCEGCSKNSSIAIRTQSPSRLPPILILTINRFYFDIKTLQRLKILTYVHIPEELVLTQKNENGLDEEITYDLYSIIVHRGKTLDYGHYYSVAKDDVESKNWILFDDSIVTRIENIEPFEYVKQVINCF